jgi:hypothetical protein
MWVLAPDPHETYAVAIVEWLFRNRQTGEITIGQPPNAPIVVFAVARLATRVLHPSGRIATALDTISRGALTVWGADELVRGVNPWRRALGAGSLLWLRRTSRLRARA